MKRINFEYFLWRTVVAPKQTKQFNHIYTYRCLIPLCFVVQSLTVSEISFGQGFLSRDRKQTNGYEFRKYEKHLEVLSFSVFPESFGKSMQPSLRNSAVKKRGEKLIRKKKDYHNYKVFRWKLKTLIKNLSSENWDRGFFHWQFQFLGTTFLEICTLIRQTSSLVKV